MTFYLYATRGDGTAIEVVQTGLNSYSIQEGEEPVRVVHKPDLLLYLFKVQSELRRSLGPEYEAYVNGVRDGSIHE